MITDDIIKLAELYAQHRAIEISTVSTYAEGDGKFFMSLKNGGDCTVRRAHRALNWFSNNWPNDLEWPRSVSRPKKPRKSGRAA